MKFAVEWWQRAEIRVGDKKKSRLLSMKSDNCQINIYESVPNENGAVASQKLATAVQFFSLNNGNYNDNNYFYYDVEQVDPLYVDDGIKCVAGNICASWLSEEINQLHNYPIYVE